MHLYKEKILQQAAVDWMRRHWDYRELASDEEATGDRMDSVGWLGCELIAIEVKPRIYGGMVYHRENGGSSLEAKVACTLADLYAGVRGGQLDILQEHWKRSAPISIGILTGDFSAEGLKQLESMLASRAAAWHFNYRIMQWTGADVIQRAASQRACPPLGLAWHTLSVPRPVGRVKRSHKSMDEVRADAISRGVGELFDACVAEATEVGFSIQPRPTGLKLKRTYPSGSVGLLAIFLDRSNRGTGLNFGIDTAGLALKPEDLPGRPAPRAGFLNCNRYLGTLGEITDLFKVTGRNPKKS